VLTTSAAGFQLAQTALTRPSVDPKFGSEDLLGIIDPDIRQPLDMMEVLLRIVDGSRIEIFKPTFGKGMITAWAHIHGIQFRILFCNFRSLLTRIGHLTGIIANQNPVILPDESDKGTQFIRLCNQG
jgi:acetyl-CoA carboxylase carboxyltransferase component